jgi:hypothetical protein
MPSLYTMGRDVDGGHSSDKADSCVLNQLEKFVETFVQFQKQVHRVGTLACAQGHDDASRLFISQLRASATTMDREMRCPLMPKTVGSVTVWADTTPLCPTGQEGGLTPSGLGAGIVRAVIGVTAFAGLIKGEVRGLWWDDDGGDLLSICRSM